MKKFIYELVTNRFGIVLATLNVCYFFLLLSGTNSLLSGQTWTALMAVNTPAFLAALIPVEMIWSIYPYVGVKFSNGTFHIVFALFMTIQWLLIAWLARSVASEIQRRLASRPSVSSRWGEF